MKKLQTKLYEIDHKGYPAYKSLKGRYQFKKYSLSIDHVQGDPFASPSSLSVRILGQTAGFPKEYYQEKHRRLALEDYLLRCFSKQLERLSFKAKGSGKSGLISTSRPGQEILERSACHIDNETGNLTLRFQVGFPARGRTVLANELEMILFELLPKAVEQSGLWQESDKDSVQAVIELADDQDAIRKGLKENGLVAFIANGSILPRESGISERPMKGAIPFQSPETMEVTLKLPHIGVCTGMGISKGVTLIVGGGYHGKSTLLQTLEKAVYPHIAGDGREYIAVDTSAMKIRAEDGRSVYKEDISAFIRNLPNGKDTSCFSTLDASGSTSQATNTVEAINAGSKLLLIDEDTSATNFMIRDELMERVISEGKEPIIPFIKRIDKLYKECGISTVLVAGSCGAFFHVADTIIQMERYLPKEITKKAKEIAEEYPFLKTKGDETLHFSVSRKIHLPKPENRSKIKVVGTDGFSWNKKQVNLRYLEQIADSEQVMAIAGILEDSIQHYGGKQIELNELLDWIEERLEKEGLEAVIKGDTIPAMAMPRRLEISGCINRFIN